MSDLTEREDGQDRLNPAGDLRVISNVHHHLYVRQSVDHLQDEMFHPAAPESEATHDDQVYEKQLGATNYLLTQAHRSQAIYDSSPPNRVLGYLFCPLPADSLSL